MEINFEISWWYMVHGSFLNDLVFVYLCISVFVYFWPLIPHDVPGVVDRKHSNVQV